MNILFNTKSLIFGEGFGFNGNILETNILNLSVVVGIVVSLGGDALRDLLENRRQSILSTISASEERAKQAAETLSRVKSQLKIAEKKAADIRQNAQRIAEEVVIQSNEQTKQDMARLEETKESVTSNAVLRAVSDVSKHTIKLALDKAKTKLKGSLDSPFHETVNNSHIVLLTNRTAS